MQNCPAAFAGKIGDNGGQFLLIFCLIARFEFSFDSMDDGLVICRSEFVDTPNGGEKMRAYVDL